MIIKLGVVAGEMLTILEREKESIKISDLREQLDHPYEIILMSLGWMVRQGYLKLEEKEDSYYVSLIPNSSMAS